jgi:hypothetical protein
MGWRLQKTQLYGGRAIVAAGILALVAGCQTAGGKPAPTAAVAPIYNTGDIFRFAVVRSNQGTREFFRQYAGTRGGNLIFLDESGQEYALYTTDLNPIKIGPRDYLPHGGMLKFPMNVGSNWIHSYTEKYGWESRDRERLCAVKSWEEVKLPAGPFMAFRISCDNQWSEARNPADEQYWYAPAAKQIVKYESKEWKYEYQLKSLQIK